MLLTLRVLDAFLVDVTKCLADALLGRKELFWLTAGGCVHQEEGCMAVGA